MNNYIIPHVKLIRMWVVMITLSSCFKEDSPVQLPTPGDARLFQVGMGEDYHRAVYFDLTTEDTTGNEHAAWDLCLESTTEGYHIWMNGGNEAMIANTNTQDFEAITDTAGAEWEIDDPDWDINETAVGDWRIDRMIYILDRGPAQSAEDRFRKIVFQSVNPVEYEVQYSKLDGSNFSIVHLAKKSGNAYIYFTFDNYGELLDIEPYAATWSILFTRYRTLINTVFPPLPYIVTGVLINPDLGVAVDSSLSFSEIAYPKALSLTYSTRRDVIGYNWKWFDFTSQAYLMKPYINYVIRDAEGVYWKLHFIDFYNSTGDKGYPQFEYQRL
ncbi:MAG: HmuY family protein [Chitinophagales bacterium]